MSMFWGPPISHDRQANADANSLEASIREDVEMIMNDPLFAGKAPSVVGLLYDVETGKLKEVAGSEKSAL